MFNMWAPRWDAHDEDWSAGRDDSTMPWYAKLDYVEYWSYDQATGQFNQEWVDNFDTLDPNMWTISHEKGFDENLSTYMNTQVYIEDG